MTIKQVLKKYHDIETELLLAHVLRKSREFVFLHGENRLTRIQANRLTRMVKRRMRGEPIAYILGYKDFYGYRFKVNRSVLIPRPETEILVDKVLQNLLPERSRRPSSAIFALRQAQGQKLGILDVGTGSGNIIISLAKALSTKHLALSTSFYGSDISPAALKVAKQNARTLLAKHYHTTVYESVWTEVKFIQSDLLQKVKGDFDIIIANLPYGWNEWKNNTSAETAGLKFEPKEALFTSDNGLYQIKRLLHQISNKKNKPKLIFLEFDPRQKKELSIAIKKILPGAETKFYRDFAGHWRCAEIRL